MTQVSYASKDEKELKGLSIGKGIHKLEESGKRGKLQKIFTITLQHFEYLKNSLDDYSFRILGFIIKGMFLSINKSYQNFIKEIERFIEVNIEGIIRDSKKHNSIKKVGKKKKEQIDDSIINTLQNISLISDNSIIEKFLKNSNMTNQLKDTLKRINNSFSITEFENLPTEKKREYLTKNFIKPLTQSLPLNSNFLSFNQSDLSQETIAENFSNYINFDFNSILNGNIEQNEQSQLQNVNNEIIIDNEENQGDGLGSLKLVDCETSKLRGHLPKDKDIIEIDLKEYLSQIDNSYNDDDSEEVYLKNVREMMKRLTFEKFANSLDNIDSFDKEYNVNIVKLFSNKGKSVQSENSSLQLRNEGGAYVEQMGISPVIDDMNKEFAIGSYIKSLGKNSVKDDNQIDIKAREEVQEKIKQFLEQMRNYQDFNISFLSRKIDEGLKSLKQKDEKEKNSFIFYNMLITCQNYQFQLKQSEGFTNFFLYD